MATFSLLISPLSTTKTIENRELSCNSTASSFLNSSKLLFAAKPRRSAVRRCVFKSPVAQKSFDHIPKQFREENLKDGLMDNFKDADRYLLYGLRPRQMEMFMTEDSPIFRQSENITEESLSSRYSYFNNGGMYTLSGKHDKKYRSLGMSFNMYRGGARRPRSPPPDLPSLLLDNRIVYLGMPIVPAVTELLIAEFMWLEYDDTTKPIYIYINSPGTHNDRKEAVGSETDAFAISDAIRLCKSPVYTLNLARAFGQAALILSLGKKGKRGVMQYACTRVHLPRVHKSGGATTDMWIKAKEVDANAQTYMDLLAKGTGKPKEEIEKDLQRTMFFTAEEAIEYGLADRIISSGSSGIETFEKRGPKEPPAQPKEMRRTAGGGRPQASPSEYR